MRRLVVLLFSGLWLLAAVAGESATNDRWASAIDNDDTDVIARLLDQSVAAGDPQHTRELVRHASTTGKSALMIACKTGNLALAQRLIAHGADVHRRTHNGGTPFMYASLGDSPEIAATLLQFAVDIDAQGSNGWSALTIAAAKGYAKTLDYLLNIGAAVNLPDVYHWSPLMRAVDNRHQRAVERLLAVQHINLDQQSDTGNTALHLAVAAGDETMVRLLLEAGSNADLENRQGESARQLAAALPNGERLTSLFPTD